VGIWQSIRGWFIRDDEPGLSRDDEADVSSVQYPKPDVEDDAGADESADSEREGEGFR